MDETKKIIREARLQKYVRILANKYDISLRLVEKEQSIIENGFVGCSDANKKIFVSEDISQDDRENLILQKMVSLHEMGHIQYTDGDIWKKSTVKHFLCNIIEDGRVEEAVSRRYPRARTYFFYGNEKLLKPRLIEGFHLKATLEDTLTFILHTAKITTGAIPLSDRHIKRIKRAVKEDYQRLNDLTRDAVSTKTETDAAHITEEIQSILEKHFNFDEANTKKLDGLAGTPMSSIESKSGGAQMPDMQEGDKTSELAKKILSGEGGDGDETRDIFDKLQEEMKEQIEKEIGSEKLEESNAERSGQAERDFNDYDESTKKRSSRKRGAKSFRADATLQGTPINMLPLDALARRMVHMFRVISSTGNGWLHSQQKGKLEMHRLPLIYTNDNNPKVFKQRKEKDKVDLSVVVLLDGSGSMSGGNSVAATETAYAVAKALEMGKYHVEVLTFGVRCSEHDSDVYGMKSFNQSMFYAENEFVARSIDGTPMHVGLAGARKSIARMKSKRKMVIVVTDGAPDDAMAATQRIHELEQDGVVVIGILINAMDFNKLFREDRRIQCYNIVQLPVMMETVIKNILITIKR